MADWRKIQIMDFKGIASANGNPKINECQECINLDPREVSGNLISRQGYVKKYDEPNVFNSMLSNIVTLSSTNFFVPDVGEGREVTLIIQQAYLNPLPGCSTSGFTVLCFLIRPYWDGVMWIDNWQWLNEMYLVNLMAVNQDYAGTHVLQMGDSGRLDPNYLQHFTMLNLSKPFFANTNIIASDNSLHTQVATTYHGIGWTAGDSILLMRNYFPLDYLKAMGENVQAKDITFHKVLNDLRIGFGGRENRLGVSIGYRKNYIHLSLPESADPMATEGKQSFCTTDRIMLDPFIPTIDSDLLSVSLVKTNTDSMIPGEWHICITAVLDDYNEFPVYKRSETLLSNEGLQIYVNINSAKINKRITKLCIYAGNEDGLYYKMSEFPFVFNSYSTAPIRERFDITGDGYYHPAAALVTMDDTTWNKKGRELSDQLGYPLTDKFALSWDQAVVAGGKTYLVNPFFEKRYQNKIFYSWITGDGAFQYDVIPAKQYFDLENFDGNDVMGIELLPNQDFMIFKRNSAQKIDSTTGRTLDLELGKGCVSRNSIVNFGNYVAWCGNHDIYCSDGNSYKVLSDETIRDKYRALTNKENITATRDEKDNSYRIFSGDTINRTEFILTKKGWFSFIQELIPNQYILSRTGYVLFMNNGDIYHPEGNSDIDSHDEAKGIDIRWKSIRIDQNYMDEESLKYTCNFYLSSVYIQYSCTSKINQKFNIKVYLNGSLFTQLNFVAKGNNILDHMDLPLGATGGYFELELNVPDATSPFMLHEIGVMWKPNWNGR